MRNNFSSLAQQRRQIDLVQSLNQLHEQTRGGDPQLEARVQSFELAYRMQGEVTEAFDTRGESRARISDQVRLNPWGRRARGTGCATGRADWRKTPEFWSWHPAD